MYKFGQRLLQCARTHVYICKRTSTLSETQRRLTRICVEGPAKPKKQQIQQAAQRPTINAKTKSTAPSTHGVCLGLLRDTSTSWGHTCGCSSPKHSFDATGSLAWPDPCKPCRIESTPKRHSASHNSSTSHNARGRSAETFAARSTPRVLLCPDHFRNVRHSQSER